MREGGRAKERETETKCASNLKRASFLTKTIMSFHLCLENKVMPGFVKLERYKALKEKFRNGESLRYEDAEIRH